jgi:hypothetical protein
VDAPPFDSALDSNYITRETVLQYKCEQTMNPNSLKHGGKKKPLVFSLDCMDICQKFQMQRE